MFATEGLAQFLLCGLRFISETGFTLHNYIYQSICADCHDGGFWGWLYGAPQLGVQIEWEEFLSKGIPELVDAAIKGTEGGMDPKGGCDDCTNEEIKAAVEYIVSQTQK